MAIRTAVYCSTLVVLESTTIRCCHGTASLLASRTVSYSWSLECPLVTLEQVVVSHNRVVFVPGSVAR